MGDPLPIEVRRLLAGPIESMEHLELLLLLARTEPRAWTPAEAASELRLESTHTERRLRDLVDAGLVVESVDASDAANPRPAFAFGPTRHAMRADVAVLLDAYNTRPVTLVRAVYDRRTIIAQSFADAFRIRKEES